MANVKAGVPQNGDMGQPRADEIAAQEMARREAQNRMEQDFEEDDRLVDRDAPVGYARGGAQRTNAHTLGDADWERSLADTDPERRRLIQERLRQNLLPDLPSRPGWHRCWVSTTSPNDTPIRRQQLGYRFLTAEQMKAEGWNADEYAVKDAENPMAGNIMWREMIGMEVPQDMYVSIMREVHHDQPMDQARGIYDSLQAASAEVTDRGGSVRMAPGMDTLRQFTRPPQQFE